MQEFVLTTRIYHGIDVLKTFRYSKLLLVTDRFFVQNGTATKIADFCENAEVQIFDQVQADPPLSIVAEGVSMLQRFAPEAVIALGGGSAIDCAKGIISMANTAADLIAIPTTSGTGSEVTSFAILTHGGIKHPLVDERLRPKIAILDNDLLSNLPQGLIADSGMDAISHCMEAIVAKNATPFTDAMAMHALSILFGGLPKSFSGDREVRGAIHAAACMAGIAFDNAGLGICHALSHAIGGLFHLAHGRINAILLPHVMRFQMNEKYDAAAKYCGFASTRAMIFAFERLRRTLQLPNSLTKAGLERIAVIAKLDEICQAALKDPCTATNPKTVTSDDLAHIVRQAL